MACRPRPAPYPLTTIAGTKIPPADSQVPDVSGTLSTVSGMSDHDHADEQQHVTPPYPDRRRDVLGLMVEMMGASLNGDAEDFARCVDTLAEALVVAFRPAEVVVIDRDAYADAVMVVSSLRERDDPQVLLDTLATLDREIALDASRRLALLGAIAQLCVDALTALAWQQVETHTGVDEHAADADTINEVVGALLSRLALARQG